MTIVDKITASIKAAHGEDFPVYYHDEETLNLLTQTMQFPCALVTLITAGNVVQEAGQAKERVSAAVFFVEPSEFDFNAVDNERIIDRCKALAFAWLLNLSGDQWLRLDTITRTSRVYGKFDDILTGFRVLAEITELNGIC